MSKYQQVKFIISQFSDYFYESLLKNIAMSNYRNSVAISLANQSRR